MPVNCFNIFDLFRWERLGDIVVLPVTSFKDPVWDSISEEFWPTIAKSLNASRLARQVSYVRVLYQSYCIIKGSIWDILMITLHVERIYLHLHISIFTYILKCMLIIENPLSLL